jgi:hypothetical protein
VFCGFCAAEKIRKRKRTGDVAAGGTAHATKKTKAQQQKKNVVNKQIAVYEVL